MAADFSPERRAHALAWIRGEQLLDASVSEDARIIAAVGLLICNDTGFLKQTELDAAMTDPSIVQAARTLLDEARN